MSQDNNNEKTLTFVFLVDQ